jgi:hypothetical protein
MVLPPPLDFRLGPAFAFDYILRLEVNGKMTETLQIGNVGKKVLFLFEQAEGRGLKYLWS